MKRATNDQDGTKRLTVKIETNGNEFRVLEWRWPKWREMLEGGFIDNDLNPYDPRRWFALRFTSKKLAEEWVRKTFGASVRIERPWHPV
jgi:hypothetical protein